MRTDFKAKRLPLPVRIFSESFSHFSRVERTNERAGDKKARCEAYVNYVIIECLGEVTPICPQKKGWAHGDKLAAVAGDRSQINNNAIILSD